VLYPGPKGLDYGCGKSHDAEFYLFEKWDPYYHPNELVLLEKYEIILCTYVLNVIPPREQEIVLDNIHQLLDVGGMAYISVRRDIPKEGTLTQWWAVPDLTSIYKRSGAFEIYEMYKAE
jgi:hypothetical protein